ncbi:MAG: hypothetical protein K2M60_07380 [Lachnospiraceae bacterium]|nr:hypothetical protein [Lachnospiraceae bacterium]MDE6252647.1 hypothetical protein [Lachnospiraceae bacterium]
MEKISQRMMEKQLQKALNECAFAQPSSVKPQGLINDKETMPKVTLIIRLEEGKLKIEETEYTREFLYVD